MEGSAALAGGRACGRRSLPTVAPTRGDLELRTMGFLAT